jgi:hypothetical protein
MPDGQHYPEYAHEHHSEGRPQIPSDDEVSSLIGMVQSFVQTYQANQVEMQAMQLKLSAAEMRAQTAEHLLRKLYTATIGYFSSDAKPLTGDQGMRAGEAAPQEAA